MHRYVRILKFQNYMIYQRYDKTPVCKDSKTAFAVHFMGLCDLNDDLTIPYIQNDI